MIIAASPPGLPRRSTTMPLAARNRSTACWKRGSTPGIQTLKPITPAVAPCAVRRSSLSTRTYIVGRLPTVAGCPDSARRSTATPTSLTPSSNIRGTNDPCGPRSRVSTIRQISTLRSLAGIVSGSRESSSETGMRRARGASSRDGRQRQRRRRAGRRAPRAARTDEANVEARVAAEIHGRGGHVVPAGRDDGEVRQPEPAQHVADYVAQLAVALRARRPRSELGLDGGPVHTVHRGIEVRVADDGPGSVERLGRPRRLRGGNRGHGADDAPSSVRSRGSRDVT